MILYTFCYNTLYKSIYINDDIKNDNIITYLRNFYIFVLSIPMVHGKNKKQIHPNTSSQLFNKESVLLDKRKIINFSQIQNALKGTNENLLIKNKNF